LVSLLGIFETGAKILGKTFESPEWNKSEALTMLFGIRASKVYKLKNFISIKCLTSRAYVFAKIAQFNFVPQG